MSAEKLTHFNEDGQAHMVDVGAKDTTKRQAIAAGSIVMSQVAYDLLASGQSKKAMSWVLHALQRFRLLSKPVN